MTNTQAKPLYVVKNVRTGQVVKTFTSREAAYRMVDRKDNAYGACVHGVFFA